EAPALILEVRKEILNGQLRLKDEQARVHTQKIARTKNGATLELKLPLRNANYSGELTLAFVGDEGDTMPLQFSVQLVEPLTLQADVDDFRPGDGRTAVRANNKLERCMFALTYHGTGDPVTGPMLMQRPNEQGGKYELRWPLAKDCVLRRMVFTCFVVFGSE